MGASSRVDRAVDVTGSVAPPVACCTFPRTPFRVIAPGRLPAVTVPGRDEELVEPPQPSREPAGDPIVPDTRPSRVCVVVMARLWPGWPLPFLTPPRTKARLPREVPPGP